MWKLVMILFFFSGCATTNLKEAEVKKAISDAIARNVFVENVDGHGSGLIIATNVILTVAHMGTGPLFCNGIPATIIKRDVKNDVMLLSVPTSEVEGIDVATKLAQDDEIFFVGNPDEHVGLISRGRVVDISDEIYIDAHATSGASGGGVYNLRGQLVGLIRAVEVSMGVIYGIVIPITKVKVILG